MVYLDFQKINIFSCSGVFCNWFYWTHIHINYIWFLYVFMLLVNSHVRSDKLCTFLYIHVTASLYQIRYVVINIWDILYSDVNPCYYFSLRSFMERVYWTSLIRSYNSIQQYNKIIVHQYIGSSSSSSSSSSWDPCVNKNGPFGENRSAG